MATTPTSASVADRRPRRPSRPPHHEPASRRTSAHASSAVPALDPADTPMLLVAVGLAVHLFADPLRDAVRITPTELHRSTTVLTKQIAAVLDGDDRLRAVHQLVVDPTRVAAADGRTVEQFARTGWSLVRDVAEQRATVAIDSALVYGETALLRLAATRAAGPDARWWGTPTWSDAVERWVASSGASRRLADRLLSQPESVSDAALAAVIDRLPPAGR